MKVSIIQVVQRGICDLVQEMGHTMCEQNFICTNCMLEHDDYPNATIDEIKQQAKEYGIEITSK